MAEMGDFMADQIVYNMSGSQDNPPVVVDVTFAGTAAPTGFGVFNAYAVDNPVD